MAGSASQEVMYMNVIRHISFRPLDVDGPLGIYFKTVDIAGGRSALTISGFMLASGLDSDVLSDAVSVPNVGALPGGPGSAAFSASAGFGLDEGRFEGGDGAAEESKLIKVGDFVVGIAGVSTHGLDTAALLRAIAAARRSAAGPHVILHLSSIPVPERAIEAMSVQMHVAAQQLLGSAEAAESASSAVKAAINVSCDAAL
jgi:hypothetical protein